MRVPTAAGTLFCATVGRGRPMLLMHGGLGLDHTYFRPWLDPLAERVELIYYDHLANGRSGYDGDPEDLSHEMWAESADALRARLGHERILLFGHSYGAFLALEYALRHPGRLDALILSNVAPVLDYMETALAIAERNAPDPETFQAAVELLSGPVEDDDALAAGMRRINPIYFHRWDPAVGEALFADVRFRAAPCNRSTFDCLPAFDVSDRLGEIRVPTLVLSGASDWITPPEHGGGRVAAGIPGAEHVVFERSGHYPFVEEAERYHETVAGWLERVETTGA